MALHRLSAIEAQRVIAVLEECTEKLVFLGSITPDVLAHCDELSQFVGDEISRIIEEQRQLERRPCFPSPPSYSGESARPRLARAVVRLARH